MTRLLDQLLARDNEINDGWDERVPLTRGAAYEHRGNLRINLGFAEAGWQDLHKAEALAGSRISYSLAAKLGEARRVYARDVLLGTPENVGIVYDAIQDSIKYFNCAEAKLKAEAARPASPDLTAVLAWVYAHRAAAYTTAYWIESASGKPDPKHFQCARDDFDEARKRSLKGDSADWIDRFQAFLHALRGDKDEHDFDIAEELLDRVKEATSDKHVLSSIERSLAMVSSYNESEEAALAAVDNALSAVEKDADDYLASYFAAASLAWLARNADDRYRYADHLKAVIQSARIRSAKTISLAYATLAGLSVLEAMTDDSKKQSAKKEAKRILNKFQNGDPYPDLETWAMFARDSAWKELEKEIAQSFARARGKEIDGAELEQEARKEFNKVTASKEIDRDLLEIYIEFKNLLSRLVRNSERACEGRVCERENGAKSR